MSPTETITRTPDEVKDWVRRLVRAATGDEWGDGDRVSDWGVGIAEPGYGDDETIWVLGDWNPARFPREGEPPLTTEETVGPRLARALDRLGVSIFWLDEWLRCDECMRIFRGQPDSYSWQMSGIITEEGGVYCADHSLDDPEWLIENGGYLNNPDNAITLPGAGEALESIGFEKYNWEHSYQNGWYPGQDDNPREITKRARRDGWKDLVFVIDSVGQFDTRFSLYVRGSNETPEDHSEEYAWEEDHDCPEIFGVWKDRLDEPRISRSMIRQFIGAVALPAEGYERRGARTNLDTPHAVSLLERFEERVRQTGGYLLEPDHERFGREWLGKYLPDVRKRFNVPDKFTMDRFIRFRWVGFEIIDSRSYLDRHYAQAVPKYAVEWDKPDGGRGRWVYYWQAWQS